MPSLISFATSQAKCNLFNGVTLLIKRKCSSMMKAVVLREYGAPDLLKLQEVSRPKAENSEVLVKVNAAGINPVDVHLREGAFMTLPPLPRILGKEVAGIIEEVGPAVTSFKVGDRVACCLPRDGGYAEYVTCPEKNLIHLSDKLTFSQGATLFVAYFIAFRALITKCKIRKGEKLLVHGGSGGVGIASIQIAKAKGLTVFGTASSKHGLEVMRKAGADHVFNHKEKGYLLKTFAGTGTEGFDVIVENCADENLGKDFTVLAKGGRIAVIGMKGTHKTAPDKQKGVSVNPRSLIYTEGQIHGVNLVAMTQEEFDQIRNDVVKGVNEGWLNPIISKEFRLSQVAQAHKYLFSGSGAQGKVVLNLSL